MMASCTCRFPVAMSRAPKRSTRGMTLSRYAALLPTLAAPPRLGCAACATRAMSTV